MSTFSCCVQWQRTSSALCAKVRSSENILLTLGGWRPLEFVPIAIAVPAIGHKHVMQDGLQLVSQTAPFPRIQQSADSPTLDLVVLGSSALQVSLAWFVSSRRLFLQWCVLCPSPSHRWHLSIRILKLGLLEQSAILQFVSRCFFWFCFLFVCLKPLEFREMRLYKRYSIDIYAQSCLVSTFFSPFWLQTSSGGSLVWKWVVDEGFLQALRMSSWISLDDMILGLHPAWNKMIEMRYVTILWPTFRCMIVQTVCFLLLLLVPGPKMSAKDRRRSYQYFKTHLDSLWHDINVPGQLILTLQDWFTNDS